MNGVIVYFGLMDLIYSVKPTGEHTARLSSLRYFFVQFLKVFCWFTLWEVNTDEEILTESRYKIGLL